MKNVYYIYIHIFIRQNDSNNDDKILRTAIW